MPYVVFGISLLVLFAFVDKVLIEATGFYIGLGLHSVVIGHVVVSLPYTMLTIMPLLERLSVSLEEASHDLGASTWQTFRRVTLPLLLPALVSSFMIAFTLSFDEYAIASFLAGADPTWPVFLFASAAGAEPAAAARGGLLHDPCVLDAAGGRRRDHPPTHGAPVRARVRLPRHRLAGPVDHPSP